MLIFCWSYCKNLGLGWHSMEHGVHREGGPPCPLRGGHWRDRRHEDVSEASFIMSYNLFKPIYL